MNSYIWRFFEAQSDNPVVPCLLAWAIVARIHEAAVQYDREDEVVHLVNRPMRHDQFVTAIQRLLLDTKIYSSHRQKGNASHRQKANADKLHSALSHPDNVTAYRPRNIPLNNLDMLLSSQTVEAIATVTCSEWLFNILETNEAFARKFFTANLTDLIFATNETKERRLESLTDYFHNNVMKLIKQTFAQDLDSEVLRKVLVRAKMSGIPSKTAGKVEQGSEEDFLSRISYALFSLQNRICPTIGLSYPIHFSAWSLAHICVADADRDSLSSNLFMVGRQSRGAGTHHLGSETRIVRDAIFTFVPKRKDDNGPTSGQSRPLSHAAYISSEDRTGYWLIGLPAAASGSSKTEAAPVWWEYTGRSSHDDMKLFFFSQHVEPRTRADTAAGPRIFNAVMLGHIRDAKRGHLPGIWIALVKRVKDHFAPVRNDATVRSGLWSGSEEIRNDTADIIFTSECLCFHGRLEEMTKFYHRCGLVGKIESREDTKEAIVVTMNATYGFGEDISGTMTGFPMQLAANFFVIPEGDERYDLVNDVFFSRGTIGVPPPMA